MGKEGGELFYELNEEGRDLNTILNWALRTRRFVPAWSHLHVLGGTWARWCKSQCYTGYVLS